MRVERYLSPFKPVQTQTCWLPMAAKDEHGSSTAIASTSTLLLFGNVTLKTVKVLITQKNRRRTFAEGQASDRGVIYDVNTTDVSSTFIYTNLRTCHSNHGN